MRFGTWNVRSLYRTGLVITVLKELSKYVRFSGSAVGQKASNLLENTHFSMERGMRIMN
jgi:hypothetical protein